MSRFVLRAVSALLLAASSLAAQSSPEAARKAMEGLQAIEAGRFEAAETAFAEARRLEPANLDYALGLAQARLSLGRLSDAAPLLEEVLAQAPGDFSIRFALAQAYLGTDRDADAARVLGGKPPDGPLRPPWLFHLGFALFRLDNYDAALPVFEKLLAYPDMRAPAEFFVANCRAGLGFLDDALPHYETAIRLGSRGDNRALNAYHYNYGLALFQLGRHAEAAEQFQTSSRLYAADPLPYYLFGRSMAELERFSEAIEAMETAVRVDADFTTAYYQLAQLHRAHGDADRARELFAKVASIKKEEFRASRDALLEMKTGR